MVMARAESTTAGSSAARSSTAGSSAARSSALACAAALLALPAAALVPQRRPAPRRLPLQASAADFSVAEIPHLRERVRYETFDSPIGRAVGSDMSFVPHPDFFVDERTYVSSQVVTGRPVEVPPTAFHRAGPRSTVCFGPGEARAAIVTCGGVCPGLNTVVRELYLCLSRQYGVDSVLGVQDGYAGFKDLAKSGVRLDDAFVEGIHARGGTVLRSSRGGHETSAICDALEAAGVNMLFLVGGDGTMKGAPSPRPRRSPPPR